MQGLSGRVKYQLENRDNSIKERFKAKLNEEYFNKYVTRISFILILICFSNPIILRKPPASSEATKISNKWKKQNLSTRDSLLKRHSKGAQPIDQSSFNKSKCPI